MANPEKKTMGRQRVPMLRMEKESNRLVTFSKRRSGLFKKVSELCTLSGSEAVVVVFSPGRKAFSFGHPSVDTIINRYLDINPSPSPSLSPSSNRDNQPPEADQNEASLFRINMEVSLLSNRIELEKKHTEELVKLRKHSEEQLFWLAPVEDTRLEHLRHLVGPMSELRDHVCKVLQTLLINAATANSLPLFQGPNPMESGYHEILPANFVEGQSLFGDQSQMGTIPTPVDMGPNDQPPMVMIPTPMGGFGDGPSLSMVGSNGIGMAPMDPSSPSIPNLLGGFDAPNVVPSQIGDSDPLGGQLEGIPFVPLNMAMNPMVQGNNVGSFTSLLMGPGPGRNPNQMDYQNVPFNPHNMFGYGSGIY